MNELLTTSLQYHRLVLFASTTATTPSAGQTQMNVSDEEGLGWRVIQLSKQLSERRVQEIIDRVRKMDDSHLWNLLRMKGAQFLGPGFSYFYYFLLFLLFIARLTFIHQLCSNIILIIS